MRATRENFFKAAASLNGDKTKPKEEYDARQIIEEEESERRRKTQRLRKARLAKAMTRGHQ
jgi:hypothetical protein